MRKQEDSTMFIDVSDDLSATTKDLSSKWHTAMEIICKDEYIPVLQVRRFVQMIRDTCQRVQDLQVYANMCLAQSPAIVVGVNIYNDAVRVSASVEELKIFVDKHVATMTDEDDKKFKNILNEIDDTLLCLMYAGESMQRRDEAVLSDPWIDWQYIVYMAGDCSFTIACHVDSEFTTLKITLTTGDFLYSEKSQSLVRMKGLEPSRTRVH